MNLPAFHVSKTIFPVMSRDNTGFESQPEPRRPSAPVKTTPRKIVILLRHGMTDWNQEGRVQGGLDQSRLNNTGSKQARQAGINLRNIPIESILCSPLRRAKDTFQLLAEASANPDLLSKKPDFLSDLIEVQVPWQGTLRKEIPRGTFKEEYTEYKRNPTRFSYNGFSPIRDLSRRAQHVWDTIARGQAGSYLVISHNQMNKALIANALQLPTNLSAWNQTNCCFNIFILEEGKPPRLRLCNGIDLQGDRTFSRRARRRKKFMRLLLHREGHVEGLLQESSGQTISHICCIGSSSNEHFAVSSAYAGVASVSTVMLPERQMNEDLFFNCLEVLETIRTHNSGKWVVVSAESAVVHSALIAACLGMGPEGVTSFHSDPGGVTVIDVESAVEIGTGGASVECHNNFAYRSSASSFLLGYTTS